tara:strand:- start:95 stop:451 length:357 start_codon:yes stop_codon:yes gene_type:complete
MDNFEKSKNNDENVSSYQKWEYKILNLNIKTESNNKNDNISSSPEIDSKKLKGVFSPDFIRDQFPEQYKKNNGKNKHPAEQLQDIFNLLGSQGWELFESSIVGRFQFFIFKRIIFSKK